MQITTVKTIAKFAVGTSVSYTVGHALANNVETEKPHQKAQVVVGAYAVGQIAADQSEPWVDKQVDNVVKQIEKIKARRKKKN